MTPTYTYVADLQDAIEVPSNGTLSRTIFDDAGVKAVLFGFDAGQELSEHTASRPALLQVLSGEARLTLGDDTVDARAGTWVHMPAGLRHSVHAHTPMMMQLVLLPAAS